MDHRVFEKMAGFEALAKILLTEKVVVLAVFLARARGAGGAGNRVVDLAGIRQLAAQRGFSRSRGAGNNEENAGAGEHGERM